MENTDDARESGNSQGVNRERTARYVLDIIPESAGPWRPTAARSVIDSARDPVSQTFPAKEHSTGIALRPARRSRALLGSDRITRCDTPTGCRVVNPAGVDSKPAWSLTRENAVVSIAPEALAQLAAHEFDLAELDPPAFGTVDPADLLRTHPGRNRRLAAFSKIHLAANPPQAPQESSGMSCSPRVVRRPAGTLS